MTIRVKGRGRRSRRPAPPWWLAGLAFGAMGSRGWRRVFVRDDCERTLLFDLDNAIQGLGREQPDHPSAVQLIGVYHNLLRRWAEL